MPQSMLSTSSVHSTVSLPPVLPWTGAPTPSVFSPEPPDPPPPQPVRTAPASARARNAPFSIRSIGFLPPAAPRRSTNVGHRCSGACAGAATRIAVAARKRCLRLGRRNLLVGADDPPRRRDRIQEERRAAVAQPVVVVVVLDVAAGGEAGARVERADRTAEALGDRALHREGAEGRALVVVVDDERVGEREDRRLDLHVLHRLTLVGARGRTVPDAVLDAHEVGRHE